ncbi:MAG TPA: hypothetical protein EYP65_05655, partial [Armatimonadetes bacterium]|nr:hypothetical protein [Armatimonadota bacterium]
MRDDFLFLIWGHGQDLWLVRRFREQAGRYGFDALDLYYIAACTPREVSRFCRNIFEANLRVVPYMWRFYYRGRDLVRKPCLTDPKYRSKVVRRMTELTEALYPYGPPGYTLGDENFLAPHGVDVCRSETCLAKFREYLKRKYGSLERVNEVLGANFPSLELLVPPTFSEAKERGLWALWAEHRRFMEEVFDEIHDLALEAIRGVDPEARVGFDGPGPTDSWHGYDWAKLLDKFRLMGTYHRLPEIEIVRSLARKGTLLGSWYGGYIAQRRPELLRWLPWSMLSLGYNSCWYFSTTHSEGAFAPDLSPHRHFLWQLPEMWAIRSGLGKLFVNCEKLHDGVAILYSQPSVHGATLSGEIEGWREAHRGTILALRDLGVGFKYVSYLDLRERGARALEGFKVLVLPLTQALSDAEAMAIEEFVSRGGFVVADLRPASMDEICRPRDGGMLSGLFGARLGPKPEPLDAEGSVRWDGLVLSLKSVRADASVKPEGAKVMGQAGRTPIVLVNRRGEGCAILLNFALSGYEGLRGNEEAEPLLSLL